MLSQLSILFIGLGLGIAVAAAVFIKLQKRDDHAYEDNDEFSPTNWENNSNAAPARSEAAVESQISSNKVEPAVKSNENIAIEPTIGDIAQAPSIISINIFAKVNQHFAGYELLQALLSAGMRFGDMDIFHRYQDINGKGPILFSLASAMEPGTFDIHNMGAYSCRGLTLFMSVSHSSRIDGERFQLMLSTAQQLAEDLDADLLDDTRNPLTAEITDRMFRQLGAEQEAAFA